MNKRMTYDEAVAYIEEVPKFTKKEGLDHTVRLLDVLGHPEEAFKVIHVAGTNGKGSVCAYLHGMLQAGGKKCGLFTSPHLVRINERFQVNGENVSDEEFLDAFHVVMDAVEMTMAAGDSHPTYFEILFLMCMVIFEKRKVEYCILETGLGGRKDLTNVVQKPLACVITSISFDHMEYLGHTIREIAGEKAGILKKETPVVYDAMNPEAAEVIQERAKELGIPAYPIHKEDVELLRQNSDGITFRYIIDGQAETIEIVSVADYQMMNAALAFHVMKSLQMEHGIDSDLLKKGIKETSWPGRMEMVRENVVVDGAHNVDGIAALIRTAQHFHEKQELTILFSAVSDKEYPFMIREICEGLHPEHVVTTKVGGYRSNSEEEMAQLFRENGCEDVYARADVEKAFVLADRLKGDGILFCVGSLYLIGELKAFLQKSDLE